MRTGCDCLRMSFFQFCLFTCLSACNDGGGGSGANFSESSLLEPGMAVNWPNGTTTETSSNRITSKILVSDLDGDQNLESIFLSVVPHSTNARRSILRITDARSFSEILTYNSGTVNLLQDSSPFSYDINGDGSKELFFVSYDRDKLHSFGFKDSDITKMQGRWTITFPEPLSENFDRKLRLIEHENKKMIKVENYGIFEKKEKYPEVISL